LAYNVSAEDFRDQLDLLLWLGYTSVNVHQIAATMLGKGTLPDRPVAITFDDDWEDQYLFAYPLLADRGMTATFYVPSTYPGGIDFMTWDQLRELSAANYEIGSHSRTHPHLAGLDYSELWPEIRISKVEIQRELRMKVWTFSYPYGEIPNPPSQLELIGQAGYEAAVIGNPDVLQSELYLLNRIEVLGGSSLSEFASLLPWRAEGREYCAAR
jgi:peptidoglycan/xylan/chitin deacetylase (PgdA/CDA1 family)